MRRFFPLFLLAAAACSSSPATMTSTSTDTHEGQPIACKTDDDCCIEDRSCDMILYGVDHPPPPTDMTCGCIHPAVQVACVSGQCTAAKVVSTADGGSTSFAPDGWQPSHCGKLPIPVGWTVQGTSTMSASSGIAPAYEKFSCAGP